MRIAIRSCATGGGARGGAGLLLLVILSLPACGDEPVRGGEGAYDPAAARDRAAGSLPLSASLTPDPPAVAPLPVDDAPDLIEGRRVLESYYAAITAGDYERAYSYWGDSGRASGQSFLEFVAGFAETRRSVVEVREGGRVEGAAGSRYLQLPVRVTATRKDGTQQQFEGTYTLRRAVVDGASPPDRRWHLYDGALSPVR